MTDLTMVRSNRPAIRGSWPWLGLLILSASYWLLAMMGLRLSPVHVPVAIQATVAFCLPIVGVIGLGKGRLPTPLIIVLSIAAIGSLALVALSTVLSCCDKADFPATTRVDARKIRLVHEVQQSLFSVCYRLNVELAAGWLWQPLELSTCVYGGHAGQYEPASLAVERGTEPLTVAIAADVPRDEVSPSVRERLGLFRVDAIGRLIPVAPSSPGP